MILLHSPKTDKTFEISGKILTVFSEGGCKSLDYLKRYIFSLVLVCLKTHSGIWSAILRPSLFFPYFFSPSCPATLPSLLPPLLFCPLSCIPFSASSQTVPWHLPFILQFWGTLNDMSISCGAINSFCKYPCFLKVYFLGTAALKAQIIMLSKRKQAHYEMEPFFGK